EGHRARSAAARGGLRGGPGVASQHAVAGAQRRHLRSAGVPRRARHDRRGDRAPPRRLGDQRNAAGGLARVAARLGAGRGGAPEREHALARPGPARRGEAAARAGGAPGRAGAGGHHDRDGRWDDRVARPRPGRAGGEAAPPRRPRVLVGGPGSGARGGGPMRLTGGGTPRACYRQLAGMDLDWSGVTAWFGDERCVPPDHEDSNYRMAAEALLNSLPSESDGGPAVHRIPGERGPNAGAEDYERELRETLGEE